jgi:hypothetical protein
MGRPPAAASNNGRLYIPAHVGATPYIKDRQRLRGIGRAAAGGCYLPWGVHRLAASIYQIMRTLVTFTCSFMRSLLLDVCLVATFVRSRKPIAYFWKEGPPRGGEGQKSLRLARAEHSLPASNFE